MKSRLVVAAVVSFYASIAYGQFQRLAIAFGGGSIPAGSSGTATSYCVDFSRHAPHSATSLNNILSGGESARVITPTRSIPLQEAVAKGYITLKGTDQSLSRIFDDPLFQERISHEPPEVQERLSTLKTIWTTLSPAEKRELERELTKAVGGDYSHVTIVNNLKEPIRIESDGPVQVGHEREAPVEIPADLRSNVADEEQRKLADEIWKARTRQHQTMLAALDLYKGKVDGKFGPGTHAAVEAFQKSNHFRVTGDLDSRTERVLLDQSQAHILNKSNTRVKTVSLNWHPKDGYTLTTPSGVEKYKDAEGMAQAVFARVADNSTSAIFIDLDGLKPKDADALAATLRVHAPADSHLRIEPLLRGEEGPMLRDILMSPGVEVVSIDRVPEKPLEATVHLRKNWLGRTRDLFVRLVAKTSALLDAAVDALQSILTASPQITFADALAETKIRLRSTYSDLSDDDLKAFVTHQARTVQISDVMKLLTEICS